MRIKEFQECVTAVLEAFRGILGDLKTASDGFRSFHGDLVI